MGAITVTLFALAGGANQFIALFNHFKEKPSPPDTYQTLAACRVMHAGQDDRLKKAECAVESIRHEFTAIAKELNHDDEARSVAIHNRLNDLERGYGELSASTNLLLQGQAQMSAKLDRIAEIKKDK